MHRAHLTQGQGGEGRVLGRFNHRAAGCQGGPHLPRDHGAGKVHWIRREEVSEEKAGPKAGGSRHQPASSAPAWQRDVLTLQELRTPDTAGSRDCGDKNTFRV